MVLIVKRFVPVYSQNDKVPKRYKNLRKNKYVTSFKYPYPNIPKILNEQYGLKWNEKIIVFSMKEISLPHFNRYRTKFRKVYYGTVRDFRKHIAGFMNRRFPKKKNENYDRKRLVE